MIPGKIRKQHSDEFKAKVALAALKSEKTINELCQEFGVAATQIYTWRDRLIGNASLIFVDKRVNEGHKNEIEKLQRVIGKLTIENDFLERVLNRSK